MKKNLDILIGNTDLALQPACKTGYGCRDCAKGRCLFRSKFGCGYVPLGSFGEDQGLVSTIKHVALNKVSPALQGLFFQGEALGVLPVERCTHCKVKLADCRICSSDAALKNIVSTINNRPLGFNISEDQVLTPYQLLLGRNFNQVHPLDPVKETNIAVPLPHVRAIVSSWFQQWNNVVFPQLFKISKRETGHPYLKKGDL